MQPLLSILIPTVVGREQEFEKLFYELKWQITDEICNEVEMVCEKDNKEMSLGEKRELLYQRARGLFSLQVDDDDALAKGAIAKLLTAIRSNPSIPCVTFREACYFNGEYRSSNHSIRYEKWQDNFDDYDYVRCAFYKDVIRTDLAQSVPFPNIRWNEDEQWSYTIKPLLTDEIHLDEELYIYQYENKNQTHEERYGFISK